MRTALILLLLLALASIPGSVFPQRGTAPERVADYITANPTVGPWLDRIGMFDVFAAPWFAAVYLLLCISLVGCIIPRTYDFIKVWRKPPVAAPSRLSRMPAFEQVPVGDDALDRAEEYLRANRWRVRREANWISAEKGYLHEVGNLLFHLCFIFLLFAVAVGGLFGWSAKVIVVEGKGFTGSLTQFDSFRKGRFVNSDQIAPFSVVLQSFTATFQETGQQRGAPRQFEAEALVSERPGDPETLQEFSVNSPLVLPGVKVFLVGHGYAPEIKITNAEGEVVFDDAVVFLPRDGNLTSAGVVKLPDLDPGFALTGLFLPTSFIDPMMGPISTFPKADNPQLFLGAFEGRLPSGGNVYTLNTEGLTRIGAEALKPGESWNLPNGMTVEFTGFRDFANVSLAHDPGRWFALGASVLVILGVSMSLLLQRRRVWVKVLPARDTVAETAEIAGLSKSGGGKVDDDVREIAAVLSEGK
jgi:cytochrome c biogenesis protein